MNASQASTLRKLHPPLLRPASSRALPPGPAEACAERAEPRESSSLSKSLAITGLGILSAAPGLVRAADMGQVRITELPPVSQLLSKSETQLGDYRLRVEPVDLDLNPRLRDGQLGLRLKGEFLKSELSRSVELQGGWRQTQGLRGTLSGEINTYAQPRANLSLEAFRRWDGSLGKDMQAMFEVSMGNFYDGVHRANSFGVQARQELKGGSFEWAGHPLSWHLEGRQSLHYHVQGELEEKPSNWRYSFLAGVRRDFPITVFGKPAVLSAIVGPELRGQEHKPLELAPKAKVRVRF